MKLGQRVQIAFGTVDLDRSLAFYDALGFERLGQGQRPYPWAQLTDGENLVLLNQDGNAPYGGLLYFHETATAVAQHLRDLPAEIVQEEARNGRLFQLMFADPDGYLTGVVNQPAAQMPQLGGAPTSHCGKFGELAHGVADLARSLAFWQKLGFDITYQSDGPPYPWAILRDGMAILGLHQTDEFRGPNLTYFAPDMAERLAKIQANGIELTPLMHDGDGPVANAAVRGPDGESFLLFTGEV